MIPETKLGLLNLKQYIYFNGLFNYHMIRIDMIDLIYQTVIKVVNEMK